MTAPAPPGTPLWTGDVAYDGARLAMLLATTGDENTLTAIVVMDVQGQPLFRFTPKPEHRIDRLFLVAGDTGPELWTFDGDSSLTRYALD